MKTVVIAITRDFIATKTVVVTHEQADKTEAITGQVAYHILSVVKQKPSGRTKCKIKMNWNLK
jgi:hypothetical protein